MLALKALVVLLEAESLGGATPAKFCAGHTRLSRSALGTCVFASRGSRITDGSAEGRGALDTDCLTQLMSLCLQGYTAGQRHHRLSCVLLRAYNGKPVLKTL